MTHDLIKAVIYARYSSAGQREESIEGQLRDCREYAQRNGITIVGEYCDRAMTGTSDKRPEFQRMIRDSAKGQFSVVVTWKNDRFARSRYDAAMYKAKLKQNGVRLIYAKEAIPEGPEGIILESVMEGYAEYYSANLSQNVKRGLYDSALKRQTLGQTCFGLRKGADKRWEIDPATGPLVRRIFEDYVGGKSAKDICDELNDAGHRTLTGNRFNKCSIRRILQNKRYYGLYEFADIYDPHGIPAIVDKDLWDRAQEVVALHHEKPAMKKIDGGFLLTGKLFCGHCGEPMTGESGTSKNGQIYYYYTCMGRRRKKCDKARARKDDTEDLIVNELIKLVQNDEIIDEFTRRFMIWQAEQDTISPTAVLEGRLKKTIAAIDNTMAVIDSGLITESLKSHLVELEAERKDLERGIAMAGLDRPELTQAEVMFFLKRFREYDFTDVACRINLVETFLNAAYLYDDGRLLLVLNHAGENNKVTIDIAEKAVTSGDELCSSSASSAVPKRRLHLQPPLFLFRYLLFDFRCVNIALPFVNWRIAMSEEMTRALRNAAASSAMEGLPLSKEDINIVMQILSGETALTDYLQQLKRKAQEA